MKNFETNLNDFLLENHMTESDLRCYLESISKNRAKERMEDQVKKNKHLEGKFFVKQLDGKGTMFPPMNRYYKVLSARSENEYRVECLIFNEHPTYWFQYQSTKVGNPGDYYLGRFEFESFSIDSIMASEFDVLREISTKEFNEAANKYLKELLTLNFVNEHYRMGGKFPSDNDWPTKSAD